LRVGDFRVFYDINADDRVVVVVAVGHKAHDRLQIGGEEIEL
jgi:mRNA-degrading endonuclease RelE of RelBE toxin-antitoxin system